MSIILAPITGGVRCSTGLERRKNNKRLSGMGGGGGGLLEVIVHLIPLKVSRVGACYFM